MSVWPLLGGALSFSVNQGVLVELAAVREHPVAAHSRRLALIIITFLYRNLVMVPAAQTLLTYDGNAISHFDKRSKPG
jgi:hypothetical protein